MSSQYPNYVRSHVERYYKHHGKVLKVKIVRNMYEEPQFRDVYFESGAMITFNKGFDGSFWWPSKTKWPMKARIAWAIKNAKS